jgi:PAS domain S-box-containing protein
MRFGKYLITVSFIVLFLFLLVQYTIYNNVKKQTIQNINISQLNHARQATTGIQDYMNNVINTLNFLSRFPEIINLNARGREIMANYQQLSSEEIKGVTRTNSHGKIIFTVPNKESIGQDISHQEHIIMSMKTHKLVISDVFMAVQGFRTIAVHVPVFKNGVYDGTLSFLLSFNNIAQKYIENIHIGKSGYAWVVSGKGIEISSPVSEHIGKNVYDTYKDFPEIITMIDDMLKGKQGVTTYHYNRIRNQSVENVLKNAAYMPIRMGNIFWSLVIATPEDEVLASLSGLRTKLLLITIALLTVFIMYIYFIVRFRIIVGEQKKRQAVLAALRESESRYKKLFEQNPAPTLIYELSTLNILAVNNVFLMHYGYSLDEVLTMHITDLYPEDQKQAIANVIKDLHGYKNVGEWRHRKKDGSYINIISCSNNLEYKGHQTRIAVVTDITERKLMEAEVRESEERFRMVFENVLDGICLYSEDPDPYKRKLIECNEQYAAMAGRSREELLQLGTLEKLQKTHDITAANKNRLESLQKGTAFQGTFSWNRPDGKENAIEFVGRPITWRGQTYTIGIDRDITERKRADAIIEESEKRLSLIFDTVGDVLYLLSVEPGYCFRFVSINSTFLTLTGLMREQVIGKQIEEVLPESAHALVRNKYIEAINGNKTVRWEEASEYPTGKLYGSVAVTPALNAAGVCTHLIGSVHDITEIRHAQEEIRKFNQELEQRVIERTAELEIAKERAESTDRLKSTFLATMSHELRTPLNSIIGFTGILLKGIAGPLNEEQLKQLGMAKGSAHHLLELINDVLDISKIEAGELVVSLRKFNFSKILKNVAFSVQPLIEKKNLKLQLKISDNVKEIYSDERRVGQIFLNLLNNAIKFTDKGLVTIECDATDKDIVTKVNDTGIGIKKEDINKLFKPFSQIDTGLTRNHDGTGLGLSICKKLLEKLCGTISVESEIGKGSTFTVTLPLEE